MCWGFEVFVHDTDTPMQGRWRPFSLFSTKHYKCFLSENYLLCNPQTSMSTVFIRRLSVVKRKCSEEATDPYLKNSIQAAHTVRLYMIWLTRPFKALCHDSAQQWHPIVPCRRPCEDVFYSTDVGDPWSFALEPPWGQYFSKMPKWVVEKSKPQRTDWKNFQDPPAFHLVLPSGQHFNYFTSCFVICKPNDTDLLLDIPFWESYSIQTRVKLLVCIHSIATVFLNVITRGGKTNCASCPPSHPERWHKKRWRCCEYLANKIRFWLWVHQSVLNSPLPPVQQC